jgi:hypothetical protein
MKDALTDNWAYTVIPARRAEMKSENNNQYLLIYHDPTLAC